ncbi:MAG: hypothetical protein CMI94_00055 [Pelagibacteraceae bacterium]|nr:hypothetical protein [Pelagibacteraceae bacterium]|tara:strand:- start:4519 stop:5583 length:1065 start_codon:yes stop_codon:yes gene_type:complete
MKKIILFIFIIIFINYNTEVLEANSEKLTKVLVEPVKKEFISESYIVNSRIAPFKSDTISVKSPGPIEDVYVEVGDFVKKGDILLKIENDELEADKNNKEGELSESLAKLELEEKKLERLEALKISPSFKRAEYEDQINIVKAAEGNLIKITSQYNKAKIIYDDAILKAPYSGFISKRFVTKGNYVNTGTPVFELVNNEKFEIEANIPSDKVSILNKKKEAEIIFPDGKILKSSFRSIIPKENPSTRTVLVRFKPLFDQKKSDLFIDQNINLKVFLKSKKQIKTIRKDALLIKNGNVVVYVIEENTAKLRSIKTGIPYQDSIEIIEGLKEGEKIVIRGNERLIPNQKVEIEEIN